MATKLENRSRVNGSAVITALLFVLEMELVVGCSWARTPTAPRRGAPGGAESTIDVREPSGVARPHWPISVGVPFPSGLVKDAAGLSVLDGDTAAPAQTRVLSRWPDGSVRWALLDWQMDLRPREVRRWRVGTGRVPVGRAMKVTDGRDRIDVDTGPLQFAVAKDRFAPLTAVRLNGVSMLAGPVTSFFDIDGKRIDPQPPTSVKVTEAGPLRTRIEVRGRYAAAFDYVVRIDAFAQEPFVRVFFTFEQHDPQPYTFVRQLAIVLPLTFTGPASYSAGREKGPPATGPVPDAGVTLLQEDNETLRIGVQRSAEHAAGWIDAHDATHGVALASRFFWQEYPQSFELRPNGLTYNLWPAAVPPAKVGMGAAKTHEFILYFHGKTVPSPGLLAALGAPLLGHVAARWMAATGALRNGIAPGTATDGFLRELGTAYRAYQAHAAVERWDDSGQVRCSAPPATRTAGTPVAAASPAEHPRRGFYGMFNWGDWNFPGFHDTTKGCDAWGNLEYDTTQVLALAYAATGEPAYHESMVAAARHFMDVDRIYYQRTHPNWVGMNHPKNPLHFAFEIGGVDLGHTWTEGLLSYYYLTGDDRGLEAARGIADYLARRSRSAALRGNPRQWGWPQIALAAVYEATGDAQYKSAAQTYARGGMAAFPPDALVGWKMGILADGLSYTDSVSRDPVIRDWLVRYAAALRARGGDVDERFLPAVAYAARLGSGDPDTATAAIARLKFGNWGKPFTIAGRTGFRILSLNAAASATPGVKQSARSDDQTR